MRKFFVMFATAAALTLGGAWAQQEPIVITAPVIETEDFADSQYWGTFSLGYPMGVAFGMGINNLINNDIDVRFMASVGTGGGFGIGADALFPLAVDIEGPIQPYLGAGPSIVVGGADFIVALKGFVGAEYRLVDVGFPEGGVFAEIGPALTILPGFGGQLNARIGFNYHF